MRSNDRFELLVSTVAVVLAPADIPRSVNVSTFNLEGILRRPLTFSQSLEGPIITSNRDQVEIQFLSNKIDVRESSGEITQARGRIPRIAHSILDTLSEIKPQSYGLNFILEIDVKRPQEWLGDNLLHPELSSKLETAFSSSLVTLILDRTPKKWTIRLETLSGERLSVNFNASENTDALPNQEMLGHEIEEQFESLKDFLNQIGLEA